MSNHQSAQDALDIVEQGFYTIDGESISIDAAFQQSLAGSRLYTPEQLKELRENLPQGAPPQVQVVEGSTQSQAQQLAAEGPLVLLNFASARNPGGGFLKGAKAQEEDLCRCSALYPTLLRHPRYYTTNRAQDSLLYTDFAIFSPAVPFFKIRGNGPLLAEPFLASVITAPAPNTRPYLQKSGDPRLLEECFERRWRNVLAIGQAEGIRTILLGAWGCGAFGGDPAMAARTCQSALADLGPAFEKVVFAIPSSGKVSKQNLNVFRQQFEN